MNVKKFEARTMKEALDMVKTQLGPDAVILSAKEITKGFGGTKSIEITAAYSENVLKQKEYVKSKMPEMARAQFNYSSAKSQKDVMKKVLHERVMQTQRMQERKTSDAAMASIHRRPVSPAPQALMPAGAKINTTPPSTRRYIEIDADQLPRTPTSAQAPAAALTEQAKNAWNNMDVQNLKTEIEQLKEIILDFKNMPQNFTQSHPGAEFGVNYSMCQQYQKLTGKGLLPEIVADILLTAQGALSPVDQAKTHAVEAWIAKYIMETTAIQHDNVEKYQLFFGPSGSGKSTAMVKLAHDLTIKQGRRVAIISTDTIKIGADEQMKVYAQMLNLPFVTIKSPSDWNRIIPYLGHVDHVLVDFASLSLRNEDEINYLRHMLPPVSEGVNSHLVLSAKAKDSDMIEIANRYKAVYYDDFIFTSLDEASQYGIIFNMMKKLQIPIFAFSVGSKVPEDFEYATVERVLDLILDITKKVQTEKSQEANI